MKNSGFIRIGTAFVDRNLCLPWAMDRPCIVCQENCPVSPKAIFTDEIYNTIRAGKLKVTSTRDNVISVSGGEIRPVGAVSGDYYCLVKGRNRIKIVSWTQNSVVLNPGSGYNPSKGEMIEVQVRLQRPFIDINLCTGCGICEHECPVSGERAIRVSGVGESRSRSRAMIIK
jgi:ferredoxin